MNTPIESEKVTLLFADFLAYLHRQGFIIGVDHHLRLQQLLNKLGPGCNPADLKFLICPIFAVSKKQQQQFYRAFDSYFKPLQAGIGEEPLYKESEKEDPQEEIEGIPKRTWKRYYIYLGILLLIFGMLMIKFLDPDSTDIDPGKSKEDRTGPGQFIEPGEIPDPGQTDPTDTEQPTFEKVQEWAGQIAALNQAEQVIPDDDTFIQEHRHMIRGIFILVPFIILFLLELYRYNRRRLLLENQRGKKPPFTWPIRVETPELALVRNEQFYESARLLRQRLKSNVKRIDIHKTISKTIQEGGFPSFQYKTVTRPPEYLVLIDLPAYRDHSAHLFDHITSALENEGLFVQRYFYEKDPRVCFKEPNGQRFYLSDFKTRYGDHRVIVFGTGEEFLDPLTGDLDKWTRLFHSWRDRALLTPEPPKKWGRREVTVAKEFIVLPASLAGLSVLENHFQIKRKPDLKAWKVADSQSPSPPAEDRYDTQALRDYLGEETFQWLCACAVYPELNWDLTLFLGSLQCMPATLIREGNVLRLIQLPWFRSGTMPDELRGALIDRLDPEIERAIRAALVELLENNPAPKGSFAYDTYQLHLVTQQGLGKGKSRKEKREMLEALKDLPEKEVMQDYTLLRSQESTARSPLSFLLPKRFKNMVYRKGVPFLGLKTGYRVMFTLLIAVGILLFLKIP
ncbi:MAG: hypothetical protein GY940_26670, partial [bacterium]|nr:hypothetical protein [bacterium]